jgi:hypothetical protein
MYPEHQRQGREQEKIVPSAEVPARVHTDGGDHRSPDKIAFG